MRITDVCKLLGVSKQMIIRLEAQGLIKTAPRDRNGHRRYVEADVGKIRQVIFQAEARAVPGAKASPRSDRVSEIVDRLRAGKVKKAHGQDPA